ncbi:MAG: hypothetical protein P9L94_17495 [Candidatus Hinthialibacter antarcticus]|nr:hypothetical protein [Candidatus Hinthialibacter antarcticus]
MNTIDGLSLGAVLSSLIDLLIVLVAIGGIGWFLYKKGSPSNSVK